MAKQATTEHRVLTVEQAEEKHGEVASCDVPGFGLVIFRGPTPGDYQRFVSHTQDDKRDKYLSMKIFVMSCLVQPDGAAFSALIAKKPAVVIGAATALQELAGIDVEFTTKKG